MRIQSEININDQDQSPQILKCDEKKTEYIFNPQLRTYATYYNRLYEKGMYGTIKYLLISIIIHIILIIISLSTLIQNDNNYKKFKEFISLNPETLISLTYTSFWCDIGKYELGILLSYFIYVILVLIYEIIFFLIHKNKIHLEIGTGILYKTIIIINFFIFTIFTTFNILILLLIIYSIIVVARSPYDFISIQIIKYPDDSTISKTSKNPKLEEWKKRTVPIIHIVILFILLFQYYSFIFLARFFLYYYLELNFDDYDDNNHIKNNNQKIKTKKIWINNNYFNVKIKPNNLYLLESEEENNREGYKNFYQITGIEKPKLNVKYSNLCLKFKEILIDNFNRNEYLFINLSHISIDDQMSISDWSYPFFNKGYNILTIIENFNFIIFLFSIIFFRLNITNEDDYEYLKKEYFKSLKKTQLYSIYGNLAKNVSISRFIFNAIVQFLLSFCVIIRMIYGGFITNSLLHTFFTFSILLIIYNIIYIILSLLISIFSIMFCASTFILDFGKDSLIKIKLILQIIFNIILMIFYITSLIFTSQLSIYIYNVIKDRKTLSETKNIVNNDLNPGLIFRYRTLNNNIKILTEYRIEGLPKYLFYKLQNEHKYLPSIKNNEIQNSKEDINTEG